MRLWRTLPAFLAALMSIAVHGQTIPDVTKINILHRDPKSGTNPTINVSRPPDVLVRGRTLRVIAAPGVSFPNLQALQLAIEQGLQGEFTIDKSDKAEATLSIAVTTYDKVSTRTYANREQRTVVVAQKTCKGLLGQQVPCPEYGMRDVPVQYWEATGALNLMTSVKDASGTLVGSFSPDKTASALSMKKELSVNGESKPGGESLPTADALLSELTRHVAQAVIQAYAKTNQAEEVPLSNSGPFKSGNGLALAGKWKEAVESWRTAKTNDEADRSYSMAVGYEALAYQAYDQSRNPDDAAPLFTQAFQLYDRAVELKPTDANFRKAQARIAASRANFARAKEQYADQQRTAQIAVAKAEAGRMEADNARKQNEDVDKELNSPRPDSQDEADFRVIVRARLRALTSEPDAAYQAQLVQFGKSAYKLDDIPARRVVHQELDHKQRAKANIELYRQTFVDLVVSDKTLDAGDRATLTKLAGRLELTPDEVHSVESQYEYKDLTKPTATTKSPAKTAPKAAVPAAPAAAPAGSAVTPAQGIPSPVPPGIKQ
jgi:hypothetical protein